MFLFHKFGVKIYGDLCERHLKMMMCHTILSLKIMNHNDSKRGSLKVIGRQCLSKLSKKREHILGECF